jgi:ligand-binding sensor domain-containing protein/signal transduction histidine kinase
VKRAFLAWLLVLAVPALAGAERLPFRVFTTADGLAGDAVRHLLRDSRGFLWIATSSGLSRFDGQAFRNYDSAEGLPSPQITALAETPDGTLWVGTSEGLARLRPLVGDGEPAFVVDRGAWRGERQTINFLAVDGAGRLWAGVGSGLAVRDRGVWRRVDLPPGMRDVGAMSEDAGGALWFATSQGLVILPRGGAPRRMTVRQGSAGADSLLRDRQGTLWIGRGDGVLAVRSGGPDLAADPRPLWERAAWGRRPREAPGAVTRFDRASGLVDDFVYALAPGRDDRLWVATHGGLSEGSAAGWRSLSVAQGLPEASVTAVLEDADGTLWVGTESRGLARLLQSGLVSYGVEDGLAGDRVTSLLEDAGGLFAVTASQTLQRLDGGRFRGVTPRALAAVQPAWGWNQFVLHDHRGRWWFPSFAGLFRFPPVAHPDDLAKARPEARFGRGNGLPDDGIFRVYEDRAGDVWVSMISTPPLVRLIGGETPAAVPEIRGPETGGAPTAFAEDREGGLWMGFYTGGLARRKDGRWRFFGTGDGVPPGFVSDLLVDRAGQLWVGTAGGGLARTASPGAGSPRFVRFAATEGLTTSSVRCLAEGADGLLYVGTPRGVDRLDPRSGRVSNLSAAAGLPNNMVGSCLASRDGSLWFGTNHGLSHLDPRREAPQPPHRILFSELRIRGKRHPLPELGIRSVSGLELAPDQNSLEVEFLAVATSSGEDVRYQHKLEGADVDWSPPTRSRSVVFPLLVPGAYRLLVRALTPADAAGSRPAELSFRLLPPIWRRPWFLALVALAGAAALAAAHRARLRRLLALERERTRIASDLHDDLGASLSRIGLLGELAQERVTSAPGTAREMLTTISAEARYLVEATSDLVWSVDPTQDDLQQLLVRLRRFAVDLLEAKGMRLEFDAPAAAAAVALSPESRRGLYLMLKEAVHNAARHSRGTRARVHIEVRGGEVRGTVEDDGIGLAPADGATGATGGGRGLPGLARRARALGGETRVESRPEGGTRISIRVPLA